MDTTSDQRREWIDILQRLARPVLMAVAAGNLRTTMPIEAADGQQLDRSRYTHLEALSRLLAGMAPWLEAAPPPGEAALCEEFRNLARAGIAAAVDPASPDCMNFSEGEQPVVDAAFLSHALLRAPGQLIDPLDSTVRSNLIVALRQTRSRPPLFNNWLLFAAMVECALFRLGVDWDPMRIDYALRQHEQWYVGDGHYGDGPQFHCDYYNSFVIHPMLLDVLESIGSRQPRWQPLGPAIQQRAIRYAAILERSISPEGAIPVVGRSLAYRMGSMQLLAQMALRRQLPAGVSPEQVREALSAVMRRLMWAPGVFDPRGWLTIGFCGHQPALGENYISTGSLYLCSTALLPLGLPVEDAFWSGRPQKWTSQRIYGGENVAADHAI